MLKKLVLLGISLLLMVSLAACGGTPPETDTPPASTESQTDATTEEKDSSADMSLEGKKILYVDSYSDAYEWSKRLTDNFENYLKENNFEGEYKIHRMNTLVQKSEEEKVQAAKDLDALVKEYMPDVVVCADDNASKYYIKEYQKNSDIPFVIIGVNWEGTVKYGFPYDNTCGLYEVPPVNLALERVKEYAEGDRIGFLSSSDDTAKNDLASSKKVFGIKFEKEYLYSNMEEFETMYTQLQDEVDIVLLNNTGKIGDWDNEKAKEIVMNNTKVPSCANYSWAADHTLVGVTTVAKEHGEFAAKTSLEILNGKTPKEIGFHDNEEGDLILNPKLAEKLGITFDSKLLNIAKIVE